MPFPSTKIARQARIVELLQTRRVRSQAELAQYLTDDGMKVTQATLSRDLVEIGAERIRDEFRTIRLVAVAAPRRTPA